MVVSWNIDIGHAEAPVWGGEYLVSAVSLIFQQLRGVWTSAFSSVPDGVFLLQKEHWHISPM